MSESYSAADVSKHNGKGDDQSLWIIIDGGVFDMTKFKDEHPGGSKILQRAAGKDASKSFWKFHGEQVLAKYTPKLKIGEVAAGAKL